MVTVKPLIEFNNLPPVVPDGQLTLVDSAGAVSVVMTSSDPDGDPLSYSWQQVEGETVSITDPTSDTLNFTAPTVVDNEILSFRITVSDGYYNVVREVNVGVRKTAQIAGIYYYHNDHLGTPQIMSDEAANVVWQASYSPFGKAEVQVETITNNIRFPGQYFDSETNLHYNYFRYYDAGTGRYITSDPIGLRGGINTYGYVGGNPVNYIDPNGLNRLRTFFFRFGKEPGRVIRDIGRVVFPPAPGLPLSPEDMDPGNDPIASELPPYWPNQYAEEGDDNVTPFPGTYNPPPEECDEEEDKGCEAIRDSILNSCASLTGKARLKCIYSAEDAYNQCMNSK